MKPRTKKVFVFVLLILVGLPLAFMASVVAWVKLSDRTNGTIVSSGTTRRYLLYVPKTYNSANPTALVISLHPAAAWPAAERNISDWNQLADKNGILVVYPAGTGFPQVWPMGPRSAEVDAKFISDLIDKLQASYNIDSARIYVDGMSNGGGMAFAVSCRLADRIAAVGAVAAAQSLPFAWCGKADPVPMMAFHGTDDRMAPYDGGTSGDPVNPRPFPGVRDWVGNWALRNHCDGNPFETSVSPHVRRLTYNNCAGNADVVLYTIEGGGHSWPGGHALPEFLVGPTTHEIDATLLLWRFYSQHPRARP